MTAIYKEITIQDNVHLAQFTTIKIGGYAQYYCKPQSVNQFVSVLNFACDNNLPFFVLGHGSNVVIDDGFFQGVVIHVRGSFKNISFDEHIVTCEAGASLMKLGNVLAERGFSGAEYMGVIPGSVGGAVRINAGTTNSGMISNHFLSAKVFDVATGSIIDYRSTDMDFAYRNSSLFNSKNVILEAKFDLEGLDIKDPEKIKRNIDALRKERSRKQPTNRKNFGSTFKKIEGGKPAGWYLDRVGMKEKIIGGAMIAPEHANWIVNIGGAKALDVKTLIQVAQKRVYDEFGVWLEREVLFLPEDLDRWQ